MRARAWLLVGTLLGLAGCATLFGGGERGLTIRTILPSTVQLRAEREGGVRRSASGVVVAAHAATGRAWIVTARHFLEPPVRQSLTMRRSARAEWVSATLVLSSAEADLALIEVVAPGLRPVALKERVSLGDDVWVIAFPWGRRLTLVSGIVSQVLGEEGGITADGLPRMVDATVSYGSSGGGVFDAESGALVAIVEGYRTAKVTLPETPGRVIEVPVPGETTVVAARAILHALQSAGLLEFTAQ